MARLKVEAVAGPNNRQFEAEGSKRRSPKACTGAWTARKRAAAATTRWCQAGGLPRITALAWAQEGRLTRPSRARVQKSSRRHQCCHPRHHPAAAVTAVAAAAAAADVVATVDAVTARRASHLPTTRFAASRGCAIFRCIAARRVPSSPAPPATQPTLKGDLAEPVTVLVAMVAVFALIAALCLPSY